MPPSFLVTVDRIGALDRRGLSHGALGRARVLVGMCLVIAVMMPPLFATGLGLGAKANGLGVVAGVFVAHLLGLGLIRIGRIEAAAWVLCLCNCGSQVFVGLHRDGLPLILNPVLLVPPALAMYLLGTGRGVWFSAFAVVELFGVYGLHLRGWVLSETIFPPDPLASVMVQIAAQGVVALGVLGWLHGVSQERAQASLTTTHATLQKSEANLLSLIDNSRDMVTLLDLQLQVVRANTAMRSFSARHFNIRVESGDGFFESVPTPGQPAWRDRIAQILAGRSLAFEEELQTQVGRCFLEHHLDPVLSSDGRVIGLTLFSRDVTARKEADARLASAQTQLRNVEKLQAMGTLSAGIAHELNNPLSVVIANLDSLKDSLDSGDVREVLELREDASAAARRIKQIVNGIRAFSQADEVRPIAVDVERAIRRSVKIAEGELNQRGVMVLELREVPRVLASEDGLVQVILNVLVNAVQALSVGAEGRVRISTREASDGRVIIEIADNGAGMTPEVRDRIFEPFFTTRPIGQGTGLGLPICHGIVTSLGGEIAVESELGKGTVIRLMLPPVTAAHA